MELSAEYITQLSQVTGINAEDICAYQGEIIKQVREVLRAAETSNEAKRITKKTLGAVLRQKSFKFI